HSRFYNEWRVPGGDELPMMIERELLKSYDDLTAGGIIRLARTEKGTLFREAVRMALETARFIAWYAPRMPDPAYYAVYAGSLVNHPADLLAMWRGFDNFMLDLARDPAKVKEACGFMADGLIEIGEAAARLTGAKAVLIGASRISASFISPRMFEEVFFETFLRIVRRLHRDGFSVTLHLDNDYTPLLDYFLEFPPRCGILHLDQTDIFRAKQILGGHICLMGNLHPGLLACGAPSEVEAACERLIKEAGAGGGFILANACEVPLDAPFENVRAIKTAVRKWGWYDS
ncbi:MAG: uroporphyrinogen decarboxylase family protein, partial [bacterium]